MSEDRLKRVKEPQQNIRCEGSDEGGLWTGHCQLMENSKGD